MSRIEHINLLRTHTNTHTYTHAQSFVGEVTTICPAGKNKIWIGLKSGTIVVIDTATLTILYSGTLEESAENIELEHPQPISSIMYIDREDNSIVLVVYKGMMWSLLDEISQDKFYVFDTYPLSEQCRLVKVDSEPNTEVWGAMDNNLLIFERECTGWRTEELAIDSKCHDLGLSSHIVHTHFTGETGLDQSHIWVSYYNLSVLISFDVLTQKQRCILDCSHYNIICELKIN